MGEIKNIIAPPPPNPSPQVLINKLLTNKIKTQPKT
jgi:hypothetical protein